MIQKKNVGSYEVTDRGLLFPKYLREIRHFIDKIKTDVADIRTNRKSDNIDPYKEIVIITRNYIIEADIAFKI